LIDNIAQIFNIVSKMINYLYSLLCYCTFISSVNQRQQKGIYK